MIMHLIKFAKKYKKTAGYAKYFTDKKEEDIAKIVNEYVKNPYPKVQKFQRDILISSLNQINTDVPRSGTLEKPIPPKIQPIIQRVLFTMYINKYQQNLWYVQEESLLVYSLYNLAMLAKPNNPEPMLYALYNTLLFKCNLKVLLFPCEEKGRGNNITRLYDYKKLNPNDFLNFLFITLLMKFRPDIFDGLLEKSKKYRNDFFTGLCKTAIMLYKEPFKKMNLETKKKIIGDTIVSKNVAVYLSYLLGFWVEYFPKNIYTFKQETQALTPWKGPGTGSDGCW